MNSKGHKFFAPAGFFGRRILPVIFLAPLCALLTGCPHNDYTVELKPTAHGVERTLKFYRVDEAFPSNELAAISQVYPAGAVKWESGTNYVARGEFAGAMPKDIGGAGSFTNYVTSLGESGFYSERFRGEDDLAARIERQFHAADQLTDLIIGWSKTEFGHERGYKKLRQFLDEDFRSDLKNDGQYFQLGAVSELSNTNAPEEFIARFGQYLFERGYVKLVDAPKLPTLIIGGGEDEAVVPDMVQKLVAEKMKIPASGPLPKSLAILTNEAALEKSWEKYLAGTDLYRAKHKAWEAKVKTDPKLAEPKPGEAANDLFAGVLGFSFDFGNTPDHLTVKLALKNAPDHSNGKWQDGQIVWEADLSNDRPLPVLCYASWSNPDEQFQKAHFGRVLLEGDELSQYDLWRSGLSQPDGQEWDGFVAGLEPGPDLKKKIEAFQVNAGDKADQLEPGRKLLANAVQPGVNSK